MAEGKIMACLTSSASGLGLEIPVGFSWATGQVFFSPPAALIMCTSIFTSPVPQSLLVTFVVLFL